MNSRRLLKRTAIIGVIAAAAMMFSCAKELKKEIFVCFYKGKVSLTRKGAPANVDIKDTVQEGDVFSIGEKSILILQSTDGLIIWFEPDTEAVMSSLNDITDRVITLKKGRVLSSIDKLKKGDGYSVKTPTVVASVRGTRFLTEYDGSKSVIAVDRGTVTLKKTAGEKDEKSVEKGNTAVEAKGIIKLRPINKVESLRLEKLENTPVVEQIQKKSPDEIKEIFRDIEKTDEKINRDIIEATGLSPDEMKEEYGRIDVITLYSGRVLECVILSRGATYKVLTQSGTIYIKAKDVRRIDGK